MHTPRSGFTIIELLVIIVIIGLLAAVGIVSLANAQRKSRDAKRLADLRELQKTVIAVYENTGKVPLTTSGTNATWSEFGATITDYITNVPIDPDNDDPNGYVYTYGANDAGSEYFVAAQLEDDQHAALTGDDDTVYDSSNAGWENLDAVESDDTSNDPVTLFDCADPVYCISD